VKAQIGLWKDTTTEQKNVMSCVRGRLAAKLMIITGVNEFF
jgi:hypothetical protein